MNMNTLNASDLADLSKLLVAAELRPYIEIHCERRDESGKLPEWDLNTATAEVIPTDHDMLAVHKHRIAEFKRWIIAMCALHSEEYMLRVIGWVPRLDPDDTLVFETAQRPLL